SLEGGSLEDFSIHLAEKWKIGSKKNNNGVILLIFRDDHKVRIEVGYGLEGALPDIVASQIIRNEITLAFREGNFDKGVSDGVSAIIQATKGEYKATGSSPNDLIQKHSGFLFILLMLYLIFPLACYVAFFAACIFILGFPAGLALGIFGTLFLLILRQALTAMGAGTTYSSRSGGFWGGGFSSGGFSGGGGGFSGGGGGSFGGGGASGGW
ncbi:MAG: methanol dehydrogenase, partial [Candidatus Omnitrophica bacterium CG07_land_8_20_14_0_80_50_8]